METYKTELHNNNVPIFSRTYNKDLFNILEMMYCGYTDLTDFEYLKIIYSELSDEVDDEEFYDLDINIDNHDLINLIYEYCLKYEVNKTLFAVEIGKYLIQNVERQFKSYEEYHSAFCMCLKNSTNKDINNNYIFLTMRMNEIIDNKLDANFNIDDYDDY